MSNGASKGPGVGCVGEEWAAVSVSAGGLSWFLFEVSSRVLFTGLLKQALPFYRILCGEVTISSRN
jgi:hypothetical protein